MSILQDFWRKPETLAPLYEERVSRWVIAYSGGVDSTCLLHLVSALERKKPLLALHINHGLHPDANSWQAHCARQCKVLGITFESRVVDVGSGAGTEDDARKARYQAFESILLPGDVLLQAHHADDQLETVLFNLLRGNGAVGLLGIPLGRPLGRGNLYRPLLTVPGAELTRWCQTRNIDWVEDDSNLDTTMDRSFLRHRVLPVIEERWPDTRNTVMKAVGRDFHARHLLESIAENDLRDVNYKGGLGVDQLLRLPLHRRENLLRHWIRSSGFPFPSTRMLSSLTGDLLQSSTDALPCIAWDNAEIRRYKGVIYINNRRVAGPSLDNTDFDAASLMESLPVTTGVGALSVNTVKDRGIPTGTVHVTIRFRRGGEKINIRGINRRLKKILQESGVPPWLRDHLPLIYQGDDLIAIPGIAAWDVEPVTASDVQTDQGQHGLQFWFREN